MWRNRRRGIYIPIRRGSERNNPGGISYLWDAHILTTVQTPIFEILCHESLSRLFSVNNRLARVYVGSIKYKRPP